MAKCIRLSNPKSDDYNTIIRVSDEEAASLVRAGEAAYVPKQLWKQQLMKEKELKQ